MNHPLTVYESRSVLLALAAKQRGDLATYDALYNKYVTTLQSALNRRTTLSVQPIPPRPK